MLQRLWDSESWQKVESGEKGLFLGGNTSAEELLSTIGSSAAMEQGRITLNGVGLAAMIVEFKDGGALIKAGDEVLLCTQSALETFVAKT